MQSLIDIAHSGTKAMMSRSQLNGTEKIRPKREKVKAWVLPERDHPKWIRMHSERVCAHDVYVRMSKVYGKSTSTCRRALRAVREGA